MHLAAAGRTESTDYLSSGVQTTAVSPCSLIPGGQHGPDPAQRHWRAGTYPLHIPASPPQSRPRAPPTLSGPQSCPAACQSLHRQSVPLAALGLRLRPTGALPLPWAGHVSERRAPGHVPGPAPLPAQPCPSCCLGTMTRPEQTGLVPSSRIQSWPPVFPITLCLALLDYPCLRTYKGWGAGRVSQLCVSHRFTLKVDKQLLYHHSDF